MKVGVLRLKIHVRSLHSLQKGRGLRNFRELLNISYLFCSIIRLFWALLGYIMLLGWFQTIWARYRHWWPQVLRLKHRGRTAITTCNATTKVVERSLIQPITRTVCSFPFLSFSFPFICIYVFMFRFLYLSPRSSIFPRCLQDLELLSKEKHGFRDMVSLSWMYQRSP